MHRARAEAAGGPLRGPHTNAARVGQQVALAVDVIPVIALHLPVAFSDHHAAQTVPGRGVSTDEPVAVAIHAAALVGVEGGAIGIEDARVGIERRRFARQGHLDGFLGLESPVVIQVQVRNFPGHQRRVRQARTVVLGGVPGNGQRCRDGFPDRLRATGRGTGRAFALANIEGDAKALVAVEFNRFDLALTYRGGQALLQRHGHFAGTGPLAARFGDDRLDLLLQCWQVFRTYALDCTHGSLHSNSAFGEGHSTTGPDKRPPTGYHGGDF